MISNHGQNAVPSPVSDLSDLYCTHDEADTRLLFHASQGFHRGFSKVMILQQILMWWFSHRCCIKGLWNIGSIWAWFWVTIRSLSPYCSWIRQWRIMGSSANAHNIRRWHFFFFLWNWKENSLGCFAQFASSRPQFCSLVSRSKPDIQWGRGCSWEICCPPLSVNISTEPCEWSEEADICFWKL